MMAWTTGFIAAIAYWPGLVAPGDTARWAALSIMIPLLALVFLPHGRRWGMAHVTLLAWLAWAAITVTWAISFPDALDGLWKACLLAAAFLLGARAATVRPALAGFVWGICVNAVFVLAQLGGSSLVLQTAAPAGLFVNRNFLAEAALLALAAGVSLRMWWSVPWCALAWLAPMSRGALLAGALVAAGWLWTRSRLWSALLLVHGAALVAAAALLQPERLASVGYRLDMWRDTLAALSPWGVGVGNYWAGFPAAATTVTAGVYSFAMSPRTAHNDLLTVAFETGVIGALLLGAVVVTALRRRSADEPAWLVFLAFVGLGLAAFPLFNPATAFMGALCAGALCRRGDALCGEFDAGGDPVRTRAAGALAVGGAARHDTRGGDLSAGGADPRGQRAAAHELPDGAGVGGAGRAPARDRGGAEQPATPFSPWPATAPGGRSGRRGGNPGPDAAAGAAMA